MASFGETLKRERELREISLRQIAEATKINIRYLEALEENRFDVLPGGLFNKGFIRAYSTFIGIDGEAMVNSYLQEVSVHLPGAGAAPVHDLAKMHRPAEVPQRRAGPRSSAASPGRSASPAITFAPMPPRTAAGAEAARLADGGPAPRPAAASEDGTAAHASRSTFKEIEAAERASPRSSRALFWILSLVAAAGVLFLLLSLLRQAAPTASRPADRPGLEDGGPETPAGSPDAPAEGAEAAPGAAGEESGGSSALLPEMSQSSHMTLGALTSAPPAATTDARPSVVARPHEIRPDAPPRPEPDALPPPPADPTPDPDERRFAGRPAGGPMRVAIEASGRTFVQVICDGRELLSRIMEAGETEEARCDAVVRVSATDAGAARVAVNGSPCLPLGDPGARVYGYTIRIDDHSRICPADGRGGHGRR